MRELVRARPLLGTLVVIRAAGASRQALMEGIDRAFARVALVHRLMSFHDPTSELTTINREAWRREVAVSRETLDVLTLAREIHRLADGVFDPAVAPHLIRWGYLPSLAPPEADRPTSPKANARASATLANLAIDRRGCVRFE